MTFELVAREGGETLSVSLYPGALAVKVGEAEVYSLDGEGRLVGAFSGDRGLRRGLDNTVVEKRAEAFTTGWRPLPPEETSALLDATARRLGDLHAAVRDGRFAVVSAPEGPPAAEVIGPWLQRASAWDSRRHQSDAAEFLRIYRRVTILPPDQYLSLVLQPTEGCQYNRCTFCDFYRDRPFRIKNPEEFRRHIEEVCAFHGRGLARRRSLFLGDANALTIAMEDLRAIFSVVQERFPVAPAHLSLSDTRRWLSAHPLGFDGIYSFLDVFSGRRKSAEEYAVLRQMGLRRVYIGLESGHAPLLHFLRKPERVDDAVDLVQTLHQAGVGAGVIVMVGAGGDRYAEGHVRDTIATLNAMELAGDDFVYLSEFVEHPGGDYFRAARDEGVRALDSAERQAQAGALRQALRFPGQPPRISVYRIAEFVY